ncbi:AtpZ/AtpI family protein [Rhizobiaceae bacterium BDR2-2]|uniref:ATP synthase protein I n=1 Tax=Ectorhizobium quercum TaxID=2965071 RepID=A0AAE3SVS2_9HYPH|nr:AtpZ/AtpI family protein [Ectorhizobium quercum]MCX8996316.1 AtpZ/AtpI family protein [Ectorhizobium quercum]MCX8998645.1 AtpZ/AtpI family protein [Ectorhizobium quercum]
MPEDREDSLDERRKRLGASLKRIRTDETMEAKAEASSEESRKGFAVAMKLSSEFISAIVVGAALGWFVDWYFGWTPWGMIFFLLLGFCAGVLNVLRATGAVPTRLADTPRDKTDDSNRDGA